MIAFFEIPATDFGRAVDFYRYVLECEFAVTEGEQEKMAFFPTVTEKCPGALSQTENFTPSADGSGVLIYLSVEDIDRTLDRVNERGGKILRHKTRIEAEGAGYFAHFTDCEGNTVGLHSAR